MRCVLTAARFWLGWFWCNLVRLACTIVGLLYGLVLAVLLFEADSVKYTLLAPLVGFAWSAWIGIVFVAMAIGPAATYLLVLAVLPLRRQRPLVHRAVAVAASPLCAIAFYASVGVEYVNAWDELACLVAVALVYGTVVKLPPSWTSRRPDEPGAAIQ